MHYLFTRLDLHNSNCKVHVNNSTCIDLYHLAISFYKPDTFNIQKKSPSGQNKITVLFGIASRITKIPATDKILLAKIKELLFLYGDFYFFSNFQIVMLQV